MNATLGKECSVNALLRSCLICYALMASMWAQAAAPSVAVYYGKDASMSELALFDIAVVEAEQGYDPVKFRSTWPSSELYAYASVAEAGDERAYLKKIPSAWKMARNGAWKSVVIDQTPEPWPAFFADEVIVLISTQI